MTDRTSTRLEELGIALPDPPRSEGYFLQSVALGDLIFTSGQIASDGAAGLIATGKVGSDVDLDRAHACARQCALNVVVQLRRELGTLDAIRRFVKVTIFVAAAPGFTKPHLAANGASELLAEVFEARGAHCRSAIAVAALPLDSPVEVEAIAQFDPAART